MATCKPTTQAHIDQLIESLRHNLTLLDAVRVRNRELIAEMPKPRPQDPQGTNLFPLFAQLDLHTTLGNLAGFSDSGRSAQAR